MPGGSCVKCSLCCGKPTEYAKDYVIKECEDAGMGQCSCRPLQDCVDKIGTCAIPFQRKTLPSTPTLTTTKTGTKSTSSNNNTINTTSPSKLTQKSTSRSNPQKDERKEKENEQGEGQVLLD
jgi:hypothetical protein